MNNRIDGACLITQHISAKMFCGCHGAFLKGIEDVPNKKAHAMQGVPYPCTTDKLGVVCVQTIPWR